MSLDPVLLRSLLAIEPYLDQVVVAGGWVPYLYQQLADQGSSQRPPRTQDIDLAVPRDLVLKEHSVDELLKAVGFKCKFCSLDTPPVTKYVAGDDDEVEIEFITDAPGSKEGVRPVQPGLTAQELRYVGLLLENTRLVRLLPPNERLTVRVPTPGAFILHKVLVVRRRREPVKKEKDLFYIFFVVVSFPEWRDAMADELAGLAQGRPRWFRRALKDLTAWFESPDAEGISALLNQRPATAYPALTDNQFRQYAYDAVAELVDMMQAIADRDRI